MNGAARRPVRRDEVMQPFGGYGIAPVSFARVRLQDDFWSHRIETNRRETIPFAFKKCEETGRIANFVRAAAVMAGDTSDRTLPAANFDDSDVFKIIEGAAYSLAAHPDPALERYVDGIIEKIARAQEPDGYLYTARTINPAHPHEWAGSRRWEKEAELGHELYNLGHLFEGAVAYFETTGKRALLDVAIKAADLLDRVFGPGRLGTAPGHQGVELALVRLYRVTNEPRYLALAKFFLDTRGPKGSEYSQAHKRIVDQRAAVGHAVRAGYMYAGIADVAALTGDARYHKALERIWRDVVATKLYLTGGIGARHSCEAFGDAYELPNMSAYCETCAAIANVYWNQRLFLLHGDARYVDVLERSLYNNVLSGVSLDGKEFFYPNPLMSMGQHQRSPWFGCSCCPSNIARFVPSIPGYIYAATADTLYVNLFAESETAVTLDGTNVRVRQISRYPWAGDVTVSVQPDEAAEFTLAVRVPGWARNKPVPSGLYRYLDGRGAGRVTVAVNGTPARVRLIKGFARIKRRWCKGDTVTLRLPMEVRRVVAHKAVKEDRGMVALQRGPLVYCLEWPDQSDKHVLNLCLEDKRPLRGAWRKDLLGGVHVITGRVQRVTQEDDGRTRVKGEKGFTAIPYYAWAHRGAGNMAVWLPRDLARARPVPRPTIASTSTVRVSGDVRTTQALSDQLVPANSNDHSMMYMHWWPRMGTQEWVEYHLEKTETVQRVKVYWFDDGPWGGCRVPASWRLLYRDGDGWTPVRDATALGVRKDRFNAVDFAPVATTGLRIEVQFQKEVSGGMLEWIVE
jgi:DUF1680 family protein